MTDNRGSSTPQRRKRPLFRKREILGMGLPLLLVASLWIPGNPILFMVVHASGMTGKCSLDQVMKVAEELEHFNRTKIDIAARISVLLKEPNGGLWKWSTPDGELWAPPETDVAFLLAEQASRFYGDGDRRVRKGDVVLDCGANIGTFTREALNAGAQTVIAIEPSERNVESLRRTFAPEIEQGRVVVFPKGVWHGDDVLKFYVYENSALDSAILQQRPEEEKKPVEVRIPVTSIDKLVAELKLDRVDFIKMDIEGAERHAIAGAATTLKKFRPRMSLATENLPDDQDAVPAAVSRVEPGYRSECGRCGPNGEGKIQPSVMYFY